LGDGSKKYSMSPLVMLNNVACRWLRHLFGLFSAIVDQLGRSPAIGRDTGSKVQKKSVRWSPRDWDSFVKCALNFEPTKFHFKAFPFLLQIYFWSWLVGRLRSARVSEWLHRRVKGQRHKKKSRNKLSQFSIVLMYRIVSQRYGDDQDERASIICREFTALRAV